MSASKRTTKQKQAILRILKGTASHPTADWVYDQARKVLPDISLGTVYRNLHVLAEEGRIMELSYEGGKRYDGNPVNHYHFTCLECGRVVDVRVSMADKLNLAAAEEIGAEVYYHRTDFYGLCSECKLKAAEEEGR